MDEAKDPNDKPKIPPLGRIERWRREVDQMIWGATDTQDRTFDIFITRWLQIFDRSIRGFITNNGPSNASSLTYTTFLTAVPLLALLLSVLKGFGVNEIARQAFEQLPFVSDVKLTLPLTPQDVNFAPADRATTASQALATTSETSPSVMQIAAATTTPTAAAQQPTSPVVTAMGAGTGVATPSASPPADGATTQTARHRAPPLEIEREPLTIREVFDHLFDLIEQQDISSLGLAGLLGMLWAVMALLSKVERFMNEAWAVHRSRTLARKFTDYMNMLMIVTMMLVGFSATLTSRVVSGRLAWMKGYSGSLFNSLGLTRLESFIFSAIPFLIVWPAFIFMYYYIPNTRVRLKSAMASGLIAGTLFQLVQVVFIQSPVLARKFHIYGVFAVVLGLLFWVYTSWCIMLWGAEVCSAHQNLRDWRRKRRQWLGTPLERETLALRLSALLAAPLLTDEGKRMDPGDLADALMLPPGPVGEMIELFQNFGLIVQSADDGAYLFARAPDSITALDILRLVRQRELRPEGSSGGIFDPLSQEMADPLSQMTVKDLALLPLEKIRSFAF